MLIIDGKFKKYKVNFNKKIKIRPTTDFAKEALFNILENKYDFKKTNVLDLCSGSGNISYEFCSRQALSVTSVEKNIKCINFIKKQKNIMNINLDIIKNDVLRFLMKTNKKFDVIFADPPYNFENTYLIHNIIFEKKILSKKGILIIEHGNKSDFQSLEKYKETRVYGKVNFSFFNN